jgi:hypothetical protein
MAYDPAPRETGYATSRTRTFVKSWPDGSVTLSVTPNGLAVLCVRAAAGRVTGGPMVEDGGFAAAGRVTGGGLLVGT